MRYWSPRAAPSSAPAGVLLANLGTPSAPTASALRPFLRRFLADPRVVELPRLLWRPLLELVVVPFRSPRSARLYRAIWTPEGSPLRVIAARQAEGLAGRLSLPVVLGMRYGEPGIAEGLRRLARAGCHRVLVLPLYPQYSGSTTGSIFDAVFEELSRWRAVPELCTVRSYATEPGYIAALAAGVREHWQRHGRGERLLLSFHGIPVRYAMAGDPYPEECRATADALAAALELPRSQVTVAFQSRFGREEWLQPYTDRTLHEWGTAGVRTVDVLAPGFAADCLETLEELARTDAGIFRRAGGERLRYIPALNDRPDHLDFLADLARRRMAAWLA